MDGPEFATGAVERPRKSPPCRRSSLTSDSAGIWLRSGSNPPARWPVATGGARSPLVLGGVQPAPELASVATIKAFHELPGAQGCASLGDCPLPGQAEAVARSRDALAVSGAKCRTEFLLGVAMRQRHLAWEACSFPRSSLEPNETLSNQSQGRPSWSV